MKKLAIALIGLSFTTPVWAQEQGYTPLQQYLYNESGYAPPELGNQPTPLPAPETPYTTAYVNPYAYVSGADDSVAESETAESMSAMPLEDF